jgi:hypothetical protein
MRIGMTFLTKRFVGTKQERTVVMETRCKTCGIVNCEGHETFADEIEEKLFEAKQRDRGPWFTTNSGIRI